MLTNTMSQFMEGRLLPNNSFFQEGDIACNMYKRLGVFDFDDEDLCHKEVRNLICEIPGCSLKLKSVMELELHYNSVHRYMCATCKKSFASAHLLDLHIEETHDSYFAVQAERKPMFRCLVETCLEKFTSSQERHCHCVDNHAFPSNFRWVTPKVTQPKKKKAKALKETSRNKHTVDEHTEDISMDVDKGSDEGKVMRGFVFGRGNMKKSFSSKRTEWHVQGKHSKSGGGLEDSKLCADLMENLPSDEMM